MKLDELLGVKKFYNMTMSEMLEAVCSELNSIGAGAFSIVFKRGSKEEVVKFWIKDDSYEDFVKYIEHHDDNPCLPKLYSTVKTMPVFFKHHEGAPEKIKYLRMEVLDPFKDRMLGELHYLYRIVDDVKYWLKEKKKFDDGFMNLFTERGVNVKELPEKLIKFVKTVFEVSEHLTQMGHKIDLHDENVMYRPSDGCLVVIDPVYNSEDLDVSSDMRRLLKNPGDKPVIGPKRHTKDEESINDPL